MEFSEGAGHDFSACDEVLPYEGADPYHLSKPIWENMNNMVEGNGALIQYFMEEMHGLRARIAEKWASMKGSADQRNERWSEDAGNTTGTPSEQYRMPFASVDHRKRAARKRAGWEQSGAAKRR
jgi:hypothetical protein